MAGAFLIVHPAGRAVGRPRIYRPRVCDLRAWRPAKPARHRDRGDAARRRRKHPPRHFTARRGRRRCRSAFLPAHTGLPASRACWDARCEAIRAFTGFLLSCRHAGRRCVFVCAPAGSANDYCSYAGYAVLHHRAGDGVEHSRRILRLCEFRLGGFSRRARTFDGGAAQAWPPNATGRVFSGRACCRPGDAILPLTRLPCVHRRVIMAGIGRPRHRLPRRCGLRGAFFAIAHAWRSPSCCKRWSSTGLCRAARAAPISSVQRRSRRYSLGPLHSVPVPDHDRAGRLRLTPARLIERSRLGLRLADHP